MKYFTDVIESASGEDAWKKISETRGHDGFGLVVCSVHMPGLGGIGLLKNCREDPDFRFTPFMMMAPTPDEAMLAVLLGELGANDFIVKPFSFDLLDQHVRCLLARMKSPQEQLYRRIEELRQSGAVEDALELIGEMDMESRLSMARWLNTKGECLLQAGRVDDAIQEFKQATETCDIYVSAYKNYATVQLDQGNVEEGIIALKRVENIGSVDNERTFLLGRLLLQTGKHEEGKGYLERLTRRIAGGDNEALLKRVAETFLEAGLFNDAEKVFQKVLKANPQDLETYNRMGIALRHQGKYTEAEQHYLNALKRYPKHAGFYYNLGILYIAWKNYEKAKRFLKRALYLDPESKDISRILDKIEKMIGSE